MNKVTLLAFQDELEKIAGLRDRIAVKMITSHLAEMRLGEEAIGMASLKDGPIAQIDILGIDPKFHGLGLGKKFYGELIRRMPNQTLASDNVGRVSDLASNVWESMKNKNSYRVLQNTEEALPKYIASLPAKSAINPGVKIAPIEHMSKVSTIHLLTGKMGAGKTTARNALADQYDGVFGSDTVRFENGKSIEATPEEKAKIRSDRLEEMMRLHNSGKRVLAEGTPGGLMKLMGDKISHADKAFVYHISDEDSLNRVRERAKVRNSSAEDDVLEAKRINGEFDKNIQIIGSKIPIHTIYSQEELAKNIR